MSIFDDEIYTISDDSDTEHAYVPKKGFIERIKTNRKFIILSGFPLLLVVVVVIILSNQQSNISQVIVTGSKNSYNNSGNNQPSSNQNTSNNQQIPTPTSNLTSTSTNNPVQTIVNQVGSLLQLHQSAAKHKPNWVAYLPGTVIQAQNAQNQNSSQQNATQTQSSQSSTNAEQNDSNLTTTPVNNDIQLVFKDPDGTVEVYQPPPSPPTDITWGRYVNSTDRYSIDYPTNWQMVKTYYNGHEGISLYMPGATIDQYAEFIGFGWATYYLLPEGVNITTAYTSPISVTGVTGTLYTQGALGYSYIASVFQYQNGYWGLGTSISDPTFAYVYDHMINSLVFNQ